MFEPILSLALTGLVMGVIFGIVWSPPAPVAATWAARAGLLALALATPTLLPASLGLPGPEASFGATGLPGATLVFGITSVAATLAVDILVSGDAGLLRRR